MINHPKTTANDGLLVWDIEPIFYDFLTRVPVAG